MTARGKHCRLYTETKVEPKFTRPLAAISAHSYDDMNYRRRKVRITESTITSIIPCWTFIDDSFRHALK